MIPYFDPEEVKAFIQQSNRRYSELQSMSFQTRLVDIQDEYDDEDHLAYKEFVKKFNEGCSKDNIFRGVESLVAPFSAETLEFLIDRTKRTHSIYENDEKDSFLFVSLSPFCMPNYELSSWNGSDYHFKAWYHPKVSKQGYELMFQGRRS